MPLLISIAIFVLTFTTVIAVYKLLTLSKSKSKVYDNAKDVPESPEK